MSIEMQHPSDTNPRNSNPNPNPNSNSKSSQDASNNPSPTISTPPQIPIYSYTFMGMGSPHRRSHSDVSYTIPHDDIALSGDNSMATVEESVSDDDLFTKYINVDKLQETGGSGGSSGNSNEGGGNDGGDGGREKHVRTRHWHSNSMDGWSTLSRREESMFDEIRDSKKAVSPEKLAHLWTVDPKRARRILANRQSAARSKERKARYISELQRKVQNLQEEATNLSTQRTIFQRDIMGLTTENIELKIRLQAMEQQVQLRDALNEALRQEVESVKIATGERTAPYESMDLGRHMPYSSSASPLTLFSLPQQPLPVLDLLPPFNNSEDGMSPCRLHPENSQPLPTILQNDPPGSLWKLDINNRGSHLLESEGSSAGESSSTY
uniref:BZIP domain-containing protein n=1 Tax=Davidia involucrata TaxID=16924 RepID=A0A5B6ZSM3_DAVIN